MNDQPPTVSAQSPAISPVGADRRRACRRRLFKLLAVVLPLLLLGAAEGILRLAGLGGYPPTFRPAGSLEDGTTLVLTDVLGPYSYFFANRSDGGALDPEAFVMPKPTGVFRVVWVGESAAKGIPQPRAFRASAFLREMLADMMPDKRVEVINVGTPGIAAYPVLGIMTESLDFQPDLIVAYLGNNEFYGAYGVASLHTAGRSPAVMRVIRWYHGTAIGQGVDRLLRRSGPLRQGTLMEAMVGQSHIGAEDSARAAAAGNLGVFVGEMAARCAARGVPIVVCTPPCNERDIAPIGEPDLSGVAPAQREAIGRELESARDLLAADGAGAEAAARRAVALMPDHAGAHFALGRALHAQGRNDEAGAEFRAAVDLDPMPWRPPSASVAAIRRAAESHGATVADLESAFRAESEGGATGWELMDDHVHPSLHGQELTARTIVRTFAAAKPAIVPPERLAGLPDRETYLRRQGANPYDAYGVAHTMRMLGDISFFKRSNPGMWQRNDAVCRRIEGQSPPLVVEQLHAWIDPAARLTDRYPVSGLIAGAFLGDGRPAEAEPLFKVAARCVTPYGSWEIELRYKVLVCAVQVRGTLSEAENLYARETLSRGRFIVDHGFSTTGQAERFVGLQHQMLGEHDRAIPYLTGARAKVPERYRVDIDESLVVAYLSTGQRDRAREIVERGVSAGGPGATDYRRMAELLSRR